MLRRLALLVLLAAASPAVAEPGAEPADPTPPSAGAPTAATPLPAEPVAARESGRRMHLRLGVFVPQHEDMDGFNPGAMYDVGATIQHSPNFALELGLGLAVTETDTLSFATSAGSVSADSYILLIPATAMMKLIAPLGGVDLYALAGGGLYYARMNVKASGSLGSASTSDSSVKPGAAFGGGVAVPVNARATLLAEVRYHVVSATFFEADGRVDGLQASVGMTFRP